MNAAPKAPCRRPEILGGPVPYLTVEGALPLQVMFWGDRWGQLRDPFGVLWSMGALAE